MELHNQDHVIYHIEWLHFMSGIWNISQLARYKHSTYVLDYDYKGGKPKNYHEIVLT